MPGCLNLMFTSNFYILPTALQQEVYGEFYRLVYPIVYVMLKDHGQVEDMIQEAFIRTMDKASQLQEMDKMEAWVITLSKNVTLNCLRKFVRSQNELDGEEIFLDKESFGSVPHPPLDQEVEAKLMEEAVVRYLSLLKPEYRQIMEMKWMCHLSFKEMAMMLNSTEVAIRQKLHRAREAIRQRLQQEWEIQ